VSQINPFHTPKYCFFKVHFNIILSYGYFSGIALGYGMDNRGFESWQGMGIFLFITVSIPALGSPQPPVKWVPDAPSLRVKRLGREADSSIRLHGMVLS
jgi:hypothetical protein